MEMPIETSAQEKREQGERFLQLSQRCHEQNWAQVHYLAEQILLHRNDEKTTGGNRVSDCNNQNDTQVPPDRTSREGSVSISGKVIHLMAGDSPNNNDDAQGETTNNNNSADADTGNLHDDATSIQSPAPLPYPAQPRMLSTCLGTASPLAWACRYSAPSSTVKLVLKLDISSVRRCLPQLGTPLHECLGRPRPLRRMPQKKTRWSDLIAGSVNSSGGHFNTTQNAARSVKSRVNKSRRNRNTSRILKGLREWRRTIRVLIKADESLLNEHVVVNNLSELTGSNIDEAQSLSRSSFLPSTIKAHHPTTRALLAQDADGNTPLHFIVRRAAAPAFGTGRWQTRDLDEEDDYDDSDNEEQREQGDDADGSKKNGNPNFNAVVDSPRVEYWGTSGSAWDGVRWCMEAHLRRVERRLARKQRLRTKESIEETDDDDGVSSSTSGMTRRVKAVHIHSPITKVDEEMSDTEVKKKIAAKRKSLDILGPFGVKADPSSPKKNLLEDRNATTSSHSRRYFNADERQDCCYDPILGSVRDLVNSCPEAVGVPDAREYEETPLVVALKSSIYVVMEHDNGFHLADRIPAGPEGIAMIQGDLGGAGAQLDVDQFPFFGAGLINNAGIGVGFGNDGAANFPLPDRPILQHDRPFEFLPNDEALMATLRGHGRRVERENRVNIQMVFNSSTDATLEKGMQSDEETKKQGSDVDDSSTCSSVSDHSPISEDDPLYDAFVPSANEQQFPATDFPGAHFRLGPGEGPRYDYQTALEYRIFCLVRIMLDAYPRASCLMISDYTPLHSAVFHGRCPDTIRLLLDAEARYLENRGVRSMAKSKPTAQSTFVPCPILSGPAMLSTNTRGELPLHFACMRNECARTVRLLSKSDPRSSLVRDAAGRTPLRWLWIRFVDGEYFSGNFFALSLAHTSLPFRYLFQAYLIDLEGENNQLTSDLHFLFESKKEEIQETSFISIQMFFLESTGEMETELTPLISMDIRN